mgnify:CR=1 FL=1
MIFLSKIWCGMIIISIIFYIVLGVSGNFVSDIANTSKTAVQNVLELCGMMCFWSGIFNVLEKTSTIEKVSTKMSKLFLKLFNKNELSDAAKKYISLNMVSNMIGIGNAATINGIKAMEEMQKDNTCKEKPSDNMAIFVLLNTASLQLIPTGMIGLRAMYGSENPGAILVPVIIVTFASLITGIISIKILNKKMV